MIDVVAFAHTVLQTDVIADNGQNIFKCQMMGDKFLPALRQKTLQRQTRVFRLFRLFDDVTQHRRVNRFCNTQQLKVE